MFNFWLRCRRLPVKILLAAIILTNCCDIYNNRTVVFEAMLLHFFAIELERMIHRNEVARKIVSHSRKQLALCLLILYCD